MPTYQFICESCGKDFEFFLTRMLRDEDKICPSCGSSKIKRAYRDFLGFAGSKSNSCGNTGCGTGSFG
jgi:putative FmdB family regulatory protein